MQAIEVPCGSSSRGIIERMFAVHASQTPVPTGQAHKRSTNHQPEEWITAGSLIAFIAAIIVQWWLRRDFPALRPPHELIAEYLTFAGFAGLVTYACRRSVLIAGGRGQLARHRARVTFFLLPPVLALVFVAMSDDVLGGTLRLFGSAGAIGYLVLGGLTLPFWLGVLGSSRLVWCFHNQTGRAWLGLILSMSNTISITTIAVGLPSLVLHNHKTSWAWAALILVFVFAMLVWEGFIYVERLYRITEPVRRRIDGLVARIVRRLLPAQPHVDGAPTLERVSRELTR